MTKSRRTIIHRIARELMKTPMRDWVCFEGFTLEDWIELGQHTLRYYPKRPPKKGGSKTL